MPTAQEIYGLRSQGGTTQITVSEGWARDSTDAAYLTVGSGTTRTLDTGTVGVGGLDAAVQADTAYALYLVQGASGPTRLIGSTSFSAPSLSGYAYRRIGSFWTDGASKIVTFVQFGMGNDRQLRYNAAAADLEALSGGSATSFTAVNMSPLVNAAGQLAVVRVIPQSGTVTVRPHGGGTEQSTTTPETFPLYIPNQSSKLDYMVGAPTTTATLLVLGQDEVV